MQDDDVLADQPAVRSILDKRSSKRKNGRKDVEYLVEFTGLPKSEAAWYAAKNVRNRYSLSSQEPQASSLSPENLGRRSAAMLGVK